MDAGFFGVGIEVGGLVVGKGGRGVEVGEELAVADFFVGFSGLGAAATGGCGGWGAFSGGFGALAE